MRGEKDSELCSPEHRKERKKKVEVQVMKINRIKIGKVLKFVGSLITLVITTFFVGSCV